MDVEEVVLPRLLYDGDRLDRMSYLGRVELVRASRLSGLRLLMLVTKNTTGMHTSKQRITTFNIMDIDTPSFVQEIDALCLVCLPVR